MIILYWKCMKSLSKVGVKIFMHFLFICPFHLEKCWWLRMSWVRVRIQKINTCDAKWQISLDMISLELREKTNGHQGRRRPSLQQRAQRRHSHSCRYEVIAQDQKPQNGQEWDHDHIPMVLSAQDPIPYESSAASIHRTTPQGPER